MARYTLREALAPYWYEQLVDRGMPEDPTPQQVAMWQTSRRARPGPRPQVIEAIERRAGGQGVLEVEHSTGLAHSSVTTALRAGTAALLEPWLGDVPAWKTGLDEGRDLEEIAELYGVPAHLVTVALNGWPPSPAPATAADVKDEALRLWRSGAELPQIADEVGVPRQRLRTWVGEGELRLTPARLEGDRVAEVLGWSPALSKKHRAGGLLPHPDGIRAGRKPWWWKATLDRFARETLTHRCPQCSAGFPSAKGLSMHRTSIHGRPPVPQLSSELEQQAQRIWREGAPLADIAAGVAVPLTQLTAWINAGELQLTPRRLRRRDLLDRFGWPPTMVHTYQCEGVLPAPDGDRSTGHPQAWWWEHTIDTLEREVMTHRCPTCGALYAGAYGLIIHQRRHAPRRP